MNRDSLDRLAFHGNIPNLEGEVIPRQNVFSILAELQVRDGADNFREKGLVCRVFLFFENLGKIGKRRRIPLEWLSQRAESRISFNFMVPLLLEYAKMLHDCG